MPYDGFVSYSHAADGRFAPALQRGLQQLAKPWYRRRALHIFRDTTALSANPGLWTSITEALDDSEYFVLLASPGAAHSEWVNREVEWWKEHKDASTILPVLTEGEWMWDEKSGDFAWDHSTAVPRALEGVFTEEPRHLDMRWARTQTDLDLRNSRFRDQVAELAAPMHHKPKDELVGEDVLAHRRTKQLASGAVLALLLLTLFSLGAAAQAVRNADEAERNLSEARAARLEADDNAAEARRNAEAEERERQRAEEAANEAEENAAAADRERMEADRQRGAAEEAAAEADRQRNSAEESATEADRQRTSAEESATEADRQRGAAEESAAAASESAAAAAASEAEARRQEALAQQEAARAAAGEQAATRAQAEAEAAAVALASANDELAATVDALDDANADLAVTNDELEVSLADLESFRLAVESLGLADSEVDTALLLAVEAVQTAAGDDVAARNALFQILREIDRGVHQLRTIPDVGQRLTAFLDFGTFYVPQRDYLSEGSNLSRSRTVAFDPSGTRVAAAATSAGIHVWDLEAPQAAPVLLPQPDGQFVSMAFIGSDRLVARFVAGSTGAQTLVLFDVDTGAQLYTVSGASTRYEVAPGGGHLAVQVEQGGCSPFEPCDPVLTPRTGQVELVEAGTGGRTGTWPGWLGSSHGGDAFSPDGSQLLLFEEVTASYVLRSVDAPAVKVDLYVADPAALVAPVFTSDGSFVVGAEAPTLLSAYEPDTGALVGQAPWIGSAIVDLAAAPVGSVVAVLDASSQVGEVAVPSLDAPAFLASVDACADEVRYSDAGNWVLAEHLPYYGDFSSEPDCEVSTDYVLSVTLPGVTSAYSNHVAARHVGFHPDPATGYETDALVDRSGALGVFYPLSGTQLDLGGGGMLTDDDRLLLWDTAGITVAGAFDRHRLGVSASVDAFAAGPGGLVAGFSALGPLVVWDADEVGVGTDVELPVARSCPYDDFAVQTLDPTGQRTARALPADAAAGCPSAVAVTDIAAGSVRLVELPGEIEPFTAGIVSWSEDGRHVLVGTSAGTAHVDAEHGVFVEMLATPVAAATGTHLAAWIDDDEVAVRSWAEPGTALAVVDVSVLVDEVTPTPCTVSGEATFALSADGRVLAGTDGSVVVLWDATTGAEKRRIPLGPCSQPASLEFSEDGRVLAAHVAMARLVATWDAETGQPLASRVLGGDGEPGAVSSIQGLEFSPDGGLLAVGSGVLLDGRTLQVLAADLSQHPDSPQAVQVAFTPGGASLLVMSEFEGSIRSFMIDAGALVSIACDVAGRDLNSAERLRFGVATAETCPP